MNKKIIIIPAVPYTNYDAVSANSPITTFYNPMEREDLLKVVNNLKLIHPGFEIVIDACNSWYSIYWQLPNLYRDYDEAPIIKAWIDSDGLDWSIDIDYKDNIIVAYKDVELSYDIDIFIDDILN